MLKIHESRSVVDRCTMASVRAGPSVTMFSWWM